MPFTHEGVSLGRKLYYARLISGKTQRQVAAKIGCDESNLRRIESDTRKPGKSTSLKIQRFIDVVFQNQG
jgi:transcriptional regulator with XRE-family HTH domain